MSYSYEENLIRVTEDTKDELIERTSFLNSKDFLYHTSEYLLGGMNFILWVDPMSPDEFDEVANVLGIEY